jgi:hypothetical protein
MMEHIKEGKDGAVIKTMPPVVLDGIIEIAMIFARNGYPFVITEKDGGKHMDGSLHYTGFAIDFRSWVVPVHKRPALLAQIKRALGPDWDVVEEHDHFHAEYQPKKVMVA